MKCCPEVNYLLYFSNKMSQHGFEDKIPFLVGAGLKNASKVACYMNAGLQAVFHVGVVVRWLLKESPHANRCSRRCQTKVCCMLVQLIKGLRDGIVCDAQPLLELFGESSLLEPGKQNDVHEFLQELLRQMDRELRELGVDGPWQEMFGTELIQRVKYGGCGLVSIKSIIETELQLTLTAKPNVSVVDLVKKFFSIEPIEFYCECCGDIKTASKSVAVTKPPAALILQLVRFKFAKKTASKITTALIYEILY